LQTAEELPYFYDEIGLEITHKQSSDGDEVVFALVQRNQRTEISDATELAGQQLLVSAENRPDPWSLSELSSENRAAMMDKARVFGVSFATVVAYEMARARVPTSRILKTMKTYDALDGSVLRQIDRINKHVDDRHLHYRLWKLSSAIDDILSEKASGREVRR